jgi:molybdenum cofactor biosynthesis enzyme
LVWPGIDEACLDASKKSIEILPCCHRLKRLKIRSEMLATKTELNDAERIAELDP